MKILNKMERKFSRFAIPHLTFYIVVGQALVFLMAYYNSNALEKVVLTGSHLMQGQIWRIITFVFIPNNFSLLWIFFTLYILSLTGNTLEHTWGTFRYNIFLFTGIILNVICSLFFPYTPITSLFLLSSIFYAFATLHPNYEFHLLFLFPVKVKWLAILALCYNCGKSLYSIAYFTVFLASLVNYFLFFSKAIIQNLRAKKRQMEFTAKTKARDSQAFHTCHECGVTDHEDEDIHFRVCSTCGEEFCEKHIKNHQHTDQN